MPTNPVTHYVDVGNKLVSGLDMQQSGLYTTADNNKNKK